MNAARQTVGVHGTYDDRRNDADVVDVDDTDGVNNKGKSIVILDDIKGDYVKCLIILRYPTRRCVTVHYFPVLVSPQGANLQGDACFREFTRTSL